jgi:hypothetical protein
MYGGDLLQCGQGTHLFPGLETCTVYVITIIIIIIIIITHHHIIRGWAWGVVCQGAPSEEKDPRCGQNAPSFQATCKLPVRPVVVWALPAKDLHGGCVVEGAPCL